MDDITLSVPESVDAAYLVPMPRRSGDPDEIVRSFVRRTVDGPFREALLETLDDPTHTLRVVSAHDLGPLPLSLLAAFGASKEQLRALKRATQFVIAGTAFHPCFPPMHEWMARTIAVGLAEAWESPVFDAQTPRILDVETVRQSIPDGSGRVRVVDYVVIPQSMGDRGIWATTKGLGRFGLPELQVQGIPPHAADAWSRVISGMCFRLLTWWWEQVQFDELPSFVSLPAELAVSTPDIAAAFLDEVTGEERSVTLRLGLNPSQPGFDTFLEVMPPVTFPRSAGEFMVHVCDELFGRSEVDVRVPADGLAMDRAIAKARASLPNARQRFLSGSLSVSERLIVKHRLDVKGGNEYPWAVVTDWRSPRHLDGVSMSDALGDDSVRAGRPIRIRASRVVDWGIWENGTCTEGGWTDAVARG